MTSRHSNPRSLASRIVVCTQTSVVMPVSSEILDAARAQDQLEVGRTERPLAGFVDDRLARQRGQFIDDVPVAMAPAAAKSNQMALWAMVTGIISLLCCQVLGPLPIVLGIVALSQIKRNPQQTGSGFAIAGIVLGILSLIIAVVGISILIAFPQYLTNLQNSFPQ